MRAFRAFALVALLMIAGLAGAQTTTDKAPTGKRVDFNLVPFHDTLFTSVDGSFRAKLDPAGHVWYATEGGLVEIDPINKTRQLWTKFEGLPSSYVLGIDIVGDKVYVGTDFGVGIIDRTSGHVEAITQANSPIPDAIIEDARVVGSDLWMGTRFFGVAVWNMTKPASDATAWTFKNTSTTADYAQSVRRITPTASAVWVATDGDGAWRYDLASRTWNVTVHDDGLPDTSAFAVAERGNDTWFGTPHGLAVRSQSGTWRVYNRTNSFIPDDRVLDVDIIPTTAGDQDVFASTRKGIWQLHPENDHNITLAQGAGILGSYIFDNEWSTKGWLVSTSRGVTYFGAPNGTQYYATGPSSGPSWGPVSFGFTSASVGDAGSGYLWFGSARGLSAYSLPANGHQGYFQNFGEWQNYPGSVVNWIDTDGNVTWFGTNAGAFGFEHDTGKWIPMLAQNSRNLVYGLEADRGEVWIPLFGDGLIMRNLTTNVTRSWSYNSPTNTLPDQYLTDIRADPNGNTMWLGSRIGLIKMDRTTGAILATYGRNESLPGSGIVFRILPEGPTMWVGTKDGGVGRFDVAAGRVTRAWNQSTSPNYPGGEARALYREGSRLWIGTTEGLAQIDITSGAVKSWNQTNSGLIQNYVNGISSSDGILYIATLSGIQRMNIATGAFYPMWDGPGVIRATSSASGNSATPGKLTVRIDSPRDGTAVTGATQIHGEALVFGAPVDRVEVKIGNGSWTPANGTEDWTFDWDTSQLPVNEPVAVAARAFAGELTGDAEILVTPVAAPKIPLHVEDIAPASAFAGRSIQFGARAEGDEPLSASLFYKVAGASDYTRMPMTRQGNLFFATVPGREVKEGDLRYYLEADSGLLTANAGDPSTPTILPVGAAPRLALNIEGPALVEAKAGREQSFALNVTNVGTQPATFHVSASGLRASWVDVPPDDITLAPGGTKAVTARLTVPAAAFADNTTLSFEVRDSTGTAEPALASVPIRIDAADVPPTAPTAPAPTPKSVIPLSPIVPLAALAIALLARRRTS